MTILQIRCFPSPQLFALAVAGAVLTAGVACNPAPDGPAGESLKADDDEAQQSNDPKKARKKKSSKQSNSNEAASNQDDDDDGDHSPSNPDASVAADKETEDDRDKNADDGDDDDGSAAIDATDDDDDDDDDRSASDDTDGKTADSSQEDDEMDAVNCSVPEVPADCDLAAEELPRELRCTGLYADWQQRTVSSCVQPYTPAFTLWTDGAEKRRYVYLPPGSVVNANDLDEFSYPPGTWFWKEFWISRDDGTQFLAETRVMNKTTQGWRFVAYVWNEDGTEAIARPEGVRGVGGTSHDVPSTMDCTTCHQGRKDFILGWDAVMLGEGAQGITMADAVARGLIETNAAWDSVSVPGDDVERAALGYLHANCGAICHNPQGVAAASGLFMRLDAGDLADVLTTAVARTGLHKQPAESALEATAEFEAGPFLDLIPQFPDSSLLLARMQVRGQGQMPPLGTHRVDEAGVAAVREWIEQMTPERGYPSPELPDPDLGNDGTDENDDDDTEDDEPDSIVSYARDLEPYVVSNCAICHYPYGIGGPGGGNEHDARHDLSLGVGYEQLTTLMSVQVVDLALVGDTPEDSYLWYKLTGQQASVGGRGTSMPYGSLPSQEMLDRFTRWIEQGANP